MGEVEKHAVTIREFEETENRACLELRVRIDELDSGWCQVEVPTGGEPEFPAGAPADERLARAISDHAWRIAGSDFIRCARVLHELLPENDGVLTPVELEVCLMYRGPYRCRVMFDQYGRVREIHGELPDWMHDSLRNDFFDDSCFEQIGTVVIDEGYVSPVYAGLDGLGLGWVYADGGMGPRLFEGPFNPEDLDKEIRSFPSFSAVSPVQPPTP